MLRACVHAAQQEAANLLADKQELLDNIRILQVKSHLFFLFNGLRLTPISPDASNERSTMEQVYARILPNVKTD